MQTLLLFLITLEAFNTLAFVIMFCVAGDRKFRWFLVRGWVYITFILALALWAVIK